VGIPNVAPAPPVERCGAPGAFHSSHLTAPPAPTRLAPLDIQAQFVDVTWACDRQEHTSRRHTVRTRCIGKLNVINFAIQYHATRAVVEWNPLKENQHFMPEGIALGGAGSSGEEYHPELQTL